MKRLVILCRHGNTFNAGDKVFMVGAREDLPLTDHGCVQAAELGAVIKEWGALVTGVFAGPLQRTAVFATRLIAAAALKTEASIDQRLIELDYGAWSGLSNEEIAKLSGQEALVRWQVEGVRPSGVTFMPEAEFLRRETDSFLADLSKLSGITVVVSSNGRLREFGRIIAASSNQSFKVRTGGVCLIEYAAGAWKIISWDSSPEELKNLIKTALAEG